MQRKILVLMLVFGFLAAGAGLAYAATGVTVNGDLTLAGSGTLGFPDGSVQSSAATDCPGRYEDNADGSITDCRTGLIWLRDADCVATIGGIDRTGTLNWTDAGSWAAALYGNNPNAIVCGLTDGSAAGDWRLPTKTEWMAMVQSARRQGLENPALTNAAGTGHWAEGDLFTRVRSIYWSGSSVDANQAWCVALSITGGNSGGMAVGDKSGNLYFVWPVRSGKQIR